MTQPRRQRRTRQDLRLLLIQAALAEFAEHGFEGASTRSIAKRADAHQPQINYHFESKEALWEAAVDFLFAEMFDAVRPVMPSEPSAGDGIAEQFAEGVRQFVYFAAKYPELNRIMLHEATSDGERLRWLVDRHVRAVYDVVRDYWLLLTEAGIAAPIDATFIHHFIVGAASLPFVNAPEARMLAGVDPMDPVWVRRHADGLVATLLPGWGS